MTSLPLDVPAVSAWSGAASAPTFAPAILSAGTPALSAAPAFAAAPPAAAPAPAPTAAAPAPAPTAIAAQPIAPMPASAEAAPANADSPAPFSGARAAASSAAGADNAGVETAARAEGRLFDGDAGARTGAAAPGWTADAFESADGLPVSFKRRAGPAGAAPRVYSGGLALNESFDPLFARSPAPSRPEYFLWTRGHRPTGWTGTAPVIDADARDLARMIVRAARESGATKVELALHSFGTLVFQRLVQLHEEPEVAQALKLLTGSRVVLLNATTHYAGSERRAGREFEKMGKATRQFVDFLDAMDGLAGLWHVAAAVNPILMPAIAVWMHNYLLQRAALMTLASQGATNMMKGDLKEPWDHSFDSIRKGFLAALAEDSQDAGWQESLLRRSSDMFRLEFTKKDVERIRRLKIRLDLVHSAGDQLLNWESARTLFELLGIAAPEAAPAPGTVLTGAAGQFRAEIVDGDHYYPLKKRDDLARRLDP